MFILEFSMKLLLVKIYFYAIIGFPKTPRVSIKAQFTVKRHDRCKESQHSLGIVLVRVEVRVHRKL